MIILGINAYHGDVSAVLLREGQLVAAVEEERFRRVKHWAGFPREAIRACLQMADVRPTEIDHIAISRDPRANLLQKAIFTVRNRPSLRLVTDRVKNAGRIQDLAGVLRQELGRINQGSGIGDKGGGDGKRGQRIVTDGNGWRGDEGSEGRSRESGVRGEEIKAKMHWVEHHPAHLASTFFASPFEEAAVCAIDGFGDFVSTSCAIGRDRKLDVFEKVYFPHSLGLLYLAITQYLGFLKYGDEFKVMGLAPYGQPDYIDAVRRVIHLKPEGRFELDLSYFRHWSHGVSMTWDEGEPTMGLVYTPKLEQLLGPARRLEEPLTPRHEAIAASLQVVFEEAAFHVLNALYEKTRLPRLCLAGGCAMNSVANGKIRERTPFKDVYIQPAAGDNGTALGAALYVQHHLLGQPRRFVMEHGYWGPEFDDEAVRSVIEKRIVTGGGIEKRIVTGGEGRSVIEKRIVTDGAMEKRVVMEQSRYHALQHVTEFHVTQLPDDELLCRWTAERIAEGKVVGWFQGRMEWGARALGNRSIVADPRRRDMREIINTKIKFREKFRPFAPSVLEEAVHDYFVGAVADPFMIQVYPVRPDKRDVIPAVTHVDGSGRLQTVNREANPRYWQLIKSFEKQTGVPVLLNTSFNENEPIVHKPEEALDCFLRTNMDVLVMGKYMIEKEGNELK